MFKTLFHCRCQSSYVNLFDELRPYNRVSCVAWILLLLGGLQSEGDDIKFVQLIAQMFVGSAEEGPLHEVVAHQTPRVVGDVLCSSCWRWRFAEAQFSTWATKGNGASSLTLGVLSVDWPPELSSSPPTKLFVVVLRSSKWIEKDMFSTGAYCCNCIQSQSLIISWSYRIHS